jgi:hypothetical protein
MNQKKQMYKELAQRRTYTVAQKKEVELQNKLKEWKRFKRSYFTKGNVPRRGKAQREGKRLRKIAMVDAGAFFAFYWGATHGQTQQD